MQTWLSICARPREDAAQALRLPRGWRSVLLAAALLLRHQWLGTCAHSSTSLKVAPLTA